jgi:hypothetical protein
MSLHRFLASTVRDIEILLNFHIRLEEAREIPGRSRFDRLSAGFQGDDQEGPRSRLAQ